MEKNFLKFLCLCSLFFCVSPVYGGWLGKIRSISPYHHNQYTELEEDSCSWVVDEKTLREEFVQRVQQAPLHEIVISVDEYTMYANTLAHIREPHKFIAQTVPDEFDFIRVEDNRTLMQLLILNFVDCCDRRNKDFMSRLIYSAQEHQHLVFAEKLEQAIRAR
jgi:hypothetical protein